MFRVITWALFVVLILISIGVKSENNVIGVDKDIIDEILGTPSKKAQIDRESNKYIGIQDCEDESGRLFFITPLLNFMRSESLISNAGKRFFDEDAFNTAILSTMIRRGISKTELCRDMKDKWERINTDASYSYWNFMDDMISCTSACGQILSAMGSAYIATSSRHVEGMVLFNYGKSKLHGYLNGDFSHSHMSYNNESSLKRVLEKAQKTGGRIGLDARASLPGHHDYNDNLSRERVMSVKSWFIRHGFPEYRITYKWLGKYGPLIDGTVAEYYKISDIYSSYQSNSARTTTALVGKESVHIYDGINQSVVMFVY